MFRILSSLISYLILIIQAWTKADQIQFLAIINSSKILCSLDLLSFSYILTLILIPNLVVHVICPKIVKDAI